METMGMNNGAVVQWLGTLAQKPDSLGLNPELCDFG